MPSISEIIEHTRQAIAEQADDTIIQYASQQWIITQIPAWKKWYLKKNQKHNYFRITQIVPPGLEEHPGLWRQKFQVWVKSKLVIDQFIEPATFDYFYNHPEWTSDDLAGMKIAKLLPPLRATL